MNDSLYPFEKKLLKEYKESLKRIRHELSEVYRKYGDDVTYQDLMKYNRLFTLEQKIAMEIKELTGESIKLISDNLKKTVRDSYKKTINKLKKSLNINIAFSGLNTAVIKEAIKNPFDRVKWQWKGRAANHASKAIEQVKSEVTQGLITGAGYSKTAANITDKINGLANNVVRIARTESHRVQVKGAVLGIEKAEKAAKRLGIETIRVISSVLDNRTRRQSEIMHGQPADKDGLFTYPNGARGLPGETGVAEYDINDREVVVLMDKKKYLKEFGDKGFLKPKPKRDLSRRLESREIKERFNDYKKDDDLYARDVSHLTNAEAKSLAAEYNLEVEEVFAINDYTLFSYQKINKKLYKNIKLSKAEQSYYDVLSSALSKLPDYNGELITYTRSNWFDEKDLIKGNEINIKAFLSTTKPGSKYQGGHGDLRIHIKTKNGKFVKDFSEFKFEEEVLFLPDSKFIIEHVEKHLDEAGNVQSIDIFATGGN